MTADTYDQLRTGLLEHAEDIANSKRPGYTEANSDVLHNFKAVAKAMGITPMQAWGIYFLKHISAITTHAKDPNIPQAEAILGRFADAINYLQLGWALTVEAEWSGDVS